MSHDESARRGMIIIRVSGRELFLLLLPYSHLNASVGATDPARRAGT